MKPIIFSAPMVQAILAGRKTQTRRVMKPQPYTEETHSGKIWRWANKQDRGWWWPIEETFHQKAIEEDAPYKPGDILWVRETWKPCPNDDNAFAYKADGLPEPAGCQYLNWRPSIHMPRSAARLFLRVTDVRAERVRDITRKDALDEGIRVLPWNDCCIDGMASGCYNGDECHYGRCQRPVELYKELWDSLNAKRGYGWNTNPWVWVYTFERITKGEAEHAEPSRNPPEA